MIKRVLFSGGGTGGHIFMAVAIAQALRRRAQQTEVLFIGSQKGVEERILPPLGFRYEAIKIGGLKGVGGLKAARTMLQIPSSLWSCWRILKRFSPSIIVGLGGYSSGPAMLVGKCMRIPSLLIEPNAHPGLANRLAARWADGAAIAFPETAAWFGSRSRLTGIPIREEFHRIDPSIAQAGPLRLLIFGGSQGSRPINRLMCEALPHLTSAGISIVHQTGPADFRAVEQQYRAVGVESEVFDFIHDMPERFSGADLVVSRAGASTLAEITAAGRPAVLIPLPQAADDHQRKNACALESKGAALVLEQNRTTGETLAGLLKDLSNDRLRLQEMARAARKLAQPKSTEKIIEFMEELIQQAQ